MFTEEYGTVINNEDRKEFQVRKHAKTYSNVQLLKSFRKNNFLKRLQLRHLRWEIFLTFC